MITRNGDRFTGIWVRGKLGGRTQINFACGDTYVGEMQMGKYHGKGKLVYAHDRGQYEGTFRHGLSRRGQRVHERGADGDFNDGFPHGEGIMVRLRRPVRRAMGAWSLSRTWYNELQARRALRRGILRGNFHGQGKYTYSDGGIYEGRTPRPRRLATAGSFFRGERKAPRLRHA